MPARKTTTYTPSENMELCRTCGGAGTRKVRDYQQSTDEVTTARCITCVGEGEVVKGTALKEMRKQTARTKKRLLWERAEIDKKLEGL